MAKMICEYDTITKTLTVTNDGKKVKASSFSANTYYDSYDEKNRGYCEISNMEYDADNKVSVSTRIAANENGEMVSSEPDTDLLKDIGEFFKKD